MKKFFQAIGAFLKRLFNKAVEEIIKNSTVAIAVVDEIEKVIENPVVAFAITLIPGKVGDWIRANEAKVLSVLDEAVILITDADTCAKKQTDKERLECFIQYLAQLPVLQKNALLEKIASIIENILSGGQSEADSDTAVQMTYKQQQIDGTRKSSTVTLTSKINQAIALKNKK